MACRKHAGHCAGCDDCKANARRYWRRREQMIADGTWQHPVPVRGLRGHLRKLLTAGMTIRGIARAADTSHTTINAILGKGNGPNRKTVNGPLAAAIFAVEPQATPPAGHTDACGTMRRLRAMTRLGYSLTEQARRSGLGRANLARTAAGSSTWVAQYVADAVRELYDRVPIDGGDARVRAWAAGRHAETGQWHGPYAWDDDTIDDPAGQPVTTGPKARPVDLSSSNVDDGIAGRVPHHALTTAERIEVVAVLAARGWSDARVGEWLRWPPSPNDRDGQHSPVLAFRVRHSVSAGHPMARLAAAAEVRQLARAAA